MPRVTNPNVPRNSTTPTSMNSCVDGAAAAFVTAEPRGQEEAGEYGIDFRIEPHPERPDEFRLLDRAGTPWARLDHGHFELVDDDTRLEIRYANLSMTPELAALVGNDALAGQVFGVAHLSAPVVRTGDTVGARGADQCTDENWPTDPGFTADVALTVARYEELAEEWDEDSWRGRLCAIHAALACARARSSREAANADEYFRRVAEGRAEARERLGEHERLVVLRPGRHQNARREDDHPDREYPPLTDAVGERPRRQLEHRVGDVEDGEERPRLGVGDGEVVHQQGEDGWERDAVELVDGVGGGDEPHLPGVRDGE